VNKNDEQARQTTWIVLAFVAAILLWVLVGVSVGRWIA
jgi:preprotein translocase subunit SecE